MGRDGPLAGAVMASEELEPWRGHLPSATERRSVEGGDMATGVPLA